MSDRIAYWPVYPGIGLALWFAAMSMVQLDRHYGTFAGEAMFWAVAFLLSTLGGWHHNLRGWPGAERVSRLGLFAAAALMALLLLVVYSPLRAAAFTLGLVQVARGFVMTTRRDLYFAYVIGFVLVFTALSHPRGDWTLALFVVPYVIAMAFTLMAEHADRIGWRGERSRAEPSPGGLLAITGVAAVSGLVLLVAAIVFFILPRPEALGYGFFPDERDKGGILGAGGAPGRPAPDPRGDPQATSAEGTPGGGATTPPDPDRTERFRRMLERMGVAARAEGTPAWQRTIFRFAIQTGNTFADASESLGDLLRNVSKRARDTARKGWPYLLASILAGLLLWIVRRLRLWARVRVAVDSWWLRWLLRRSARLAALECFHALERAGALHGSARKFSMTANEYGLSLSLKFYPVHRQVREIVAAFDRARYALRSPTASEATLAYRSYREVAHYLRDAAL